MRTRDRSTRVRRRPARAVLASVGLHAAALGVVFGLVGGEPAETATRVEFARLVEVPVLAEMPPPPPPTAPLPPRPTVDEPRYDDPPPLTDVCVEPTPARVSPTAFEVDPRTANAALPRPLRTRRAPRAPVQPAVTTTPLPATPPAPRTTAAPTSEPALDPGPPNAAPAPTAPAPLVRPVALPTNRPPSYPRLARRRGWTGVVLLSIRISPAGDVVDVDVVESSGHDPLDAAARDAASEWRYEPARRGDQAVETTIRQPVRFAL